MHFEKSIDKLNKIIEQLESGQLSLEETIELYKDGNMLISSCKKELETAKQTISEYNAEADK